MRSKRNTVALTLKARGQLTRILNTYTHFEQEELVKITKSGGQQIYGLKYKYTIQAILSFFKPQTLENKNPTSIGDLPPFQWTQFSNKPALTQTH